VAKGLGLKLDEIVKLAKMTDDERAVATAT